MQTVRATLADVPLLVEMMTTFYAESNHLLDRQWAASSFNGIIQNGDRGAVWIAELHGEAAGYAALAFKHSMEFGGLSVIVEDLFVLSGCRRQGVGTALLRSVLDVCEDLKAKAIEVEVGSDNGPALKLYAECGLVANDLGRRRLARSLSIGENPNTS